MEIKIKWYSDKHGNQIISYQENDDSPILFNFEFLSIQCSDTMDEIKDSIIKILES